MQFKDNNASKTSVHHDLIQANNEVLSNEVMLDSSNNLDNNFFASIAGNAGNDLLLSSETSQDKTNNKALMLMM